MTNEEKANEISCGQASETDYIKTAAYNGAIEMAEWKDKQIDTILLTAEACLRSFLDSQGNTPESITNFLSAIKKQIDINLSEL